MAIKKGSKKTQIVEALFQTYGLNRIVTADQIKTAMTDAGVDLSKNNPANFLKDLIRKTSVNANWPGSLTRDRISARQRYGSGRVLEFFEHSPEWPTPFIDRFRPTEQTPVYTVQTASLPYLARTLGRRDEAWLVQVTVNQRLVETQLGVFSPPDLIPRLRDVTHLQMSVKTQPEIDALYVATYNVSSKPKIEEIGTTLITCEAKQRNERILEDQIREQVRMAFQITAKLKAFSVDSVKPLAVQVVQQEYSGRMESMIFMVEFEPFERGEFAEALADSDEEVYWTLPLTQSSSTLYRFSPPLPAVGMPRKI